MAGIVSPSYPSPYPPQYKVALPKPATPSIAGAPGGVSGGLGRPATYYYKGVAYNSPAEIEAAKRKELAAVQKGGPGSQYTTVPEGDVSSTITPGTMTGYTPPGGGG